MADTPDACNALIVIPTLNEVDNIAKVLSSIVSTSGIGAARVVVVDGGSHDGTQAVVENIARTDPRISLLQSDRPTPIQSASINLAVERFGANMQWLVRMDAHAIYPAGYVSRLIAVAEATGASCVTTPMKTLGGSCFQAAAAAAQNSVLGTGGAPHRRTGVSRWVDHGHHALMRMAVFVAAGGYDETFSHNEDAELDRRIVQNGGRIWLAADLMIGYIPRRNSGALFRQYIKYGQGRARTLARHGGRRKLRQLAPLLVAPAALLAIAFPIWPIAAAPALIWLITSLAAGLALGLLEVMRGGGGCALLSGYCAAIMPLGWSIGYWRQALCAKPTPPFKSKLSVHWTNSEEPNASPHRRALPTEAGANASVS